MRGMKQGLLLKTRRLSTFPQDNLNVEQLLEMSITIQRAAQYEQNESVVKLFKESIEHRDAVTSNSFNLEISISSCLTGQ